MPYIVTVIVNLANTEFGWEASITQVTATKRGRSLIITIEKDFYNSKEIAWDKIKGAVQNLDFGNLEVLFNRIKVSSYGDVIKSVDQICENEIDYLPKVGP